MKFEIDIDYQKGNATEEQYFCYDDEKHTLEECHTLPGCSSLKDLDVWAPCTRRSCSAAAWKELVKRVISHYINGLNFNETGVIEKVTIYKEI